MIAYETHRIQLLAGRPGRHHDRQIGQILACQCLQGCFKDSFRRRQFAFPFPTTGQGALLGRYEQVARTPQPFLVFAINRIGVHVDVHGWSNQQRRLGSHDSCGEHVIGNAAGQLADDIGCSRGNNKQVSPVSQGNVADLALGNQVE